jgi:glutamine amidotransferase
MNGESGYVAIIDYELGNLFSVQQACIKVGLISVITNDKVTINKAKAIILPGVGAFGDAMKNLEKTDLIFPIKEFVESGKPVFGICLGMQLLFEESEEFGNNKGLGIIAGKIRSFPKTNSGLKIKVPNVGWNTIYSKDKAWETTPLGHVFCSFIFCSTLRKGKHIVLFVL